MSTKHTEGPWHVEAMTDSAGRQSFAICHFADTIGEAYKADRTETTRANASLIAAAPDLLAALRDAARAIDTVRDRAPDTSSNAKQCAAHRAELRAIAAAALAAIAKATGGAA